MIDPSNKQQIKTVQQFLKDFGYDPKGIDGIVGKNTFSALDQFVFDIKNPRKTPKNNKEVIDDIILSAAQQGFTEKQIAYILATVKHETGDTFKPVKEAYWLSEKWRMKNLRYAPWYGRGYTQITWKTNYEKFSKLTGQDLVNNPELALRHDIALFILLYGFKNGTFTGKKLSDYVNESKTDYVNARRCINGTDKAKLIASHAENYYSKYFQ